MTALTNETSRSPNYHKSVKIISLIVLTLQNAILSLSMRYVRTQPGDMFYSSTAVVMTEVVKCVSSLFLVYVTEALSIMHFFKIVYGTIIKQPIDTLKVCIPSIVYIIQNNLLYLASTHLDAATVQITYQLKVLTTAIFAVCLLRRSLGIHQWTSLVLLLVGVGLVQVADVKDQKLTTNIEQNRVIGMIAALSACVLSGFAGIYFEKILKGSDISVWMRNVQLSIISVPAGLIHAYVEDWNNLMKNGFFFGYNYFVIYVIFLQAIGGLLVAIVVKYADNILKGFATSLAIIISCIFSMYLFDFIINFQFVVGALFVIASVFLYGYPFPTKPKYLAKEKVQNGSYV
ncbi:hypothetical protein PGB90_003123 [Kerria lacca]